MCPDFLGFVRLDPKPGPTQTMAMYNARCYDVVPAASLHKNSEAARIGTSMRNPK
jgi:hypothetical protein